MRNAFRIFIFFAIYFLSLSAIAVGDADATAGAAGARNVAGKIDLMEGDTRVFDDKKMPRTVKIGDTLFEGDSIVTGADGEIHLTMEDAGFIAVRPNTKMRIAQYRANGDDQDKGVIGLLVGSLRSITGWIGKYQPKSYTIRTPTATIGIRGTDHEPKVIPEGSAEGDAGTYDKVNTGGSFIRTPQGSVDVSERHAAFAPVSHGGVISRPRLLDHVPSFYRPTRNEHLIEGKHEQIQRSLEKRREEKRQQISNNRHAQAQRQKPGLNAEKQHAPKVRRPGDREEKLAAKANKQQHAATDKPNQKNKKNDKERKDKKDTD
jgi:hypothetical protein